MTAYVIGEIDVTDAAAYDEYRRQVLATVQKHGGRFLARGGRAEALEGSAPPRRVVVLEFPSYEQALKWYRSPEYGPLIALRQKASRGRLLLVEGG
ncbi:MAG TPA: DUF1330 domain-containing protein [Burkholderiales bacterium]|nr:DUF1330 domain-containing protein [Burkholderiales bacterium]